MESLIPHLGWLAHPPDDEVARFLAEGWFEYREQAFCWLYLRRGDTVVDAGAHFGLYAALAGHLTGESGRVLAVEANPTIMPLLAENLGRYAADRGELIAAALASHAGEVDFFPSGGARAAYSGTVAESPGAPACRVPTLTMDELCRERAVTRVALAKLDLEGDEIEALRGARESIGQGVLPLWMVEFAEANMRRRGLDTRSLFEEIASLGYTVCRFDERRCRLAPVKWMEPVWYENYFATTSLDVVNRRLSECSIESARAARDILRRGAAAMGLHDAAVEAAQLRAGAERRTAEAEARAREAALQATEAARRGDEEKGQSARYVEAARQMAEAAGRRAEEASGHLEESWRRIGQANWRADQAGERADKAGERAEATRRCLEVADRRAANARYEADLLKTRLRDLLLVRGVGRLRKAAWAKAFLASAEALAPPVCSGSDSSDPMQHALYHLVGKNFVPSAVLDVGAGKGYWSLNAQTFFPEAEYYMVDPLDEHEEELCRICERNSRFHFVKAALGNTDGTGHIHVTPDLFGSHMLPHPDADRTRERVVLQRTADSLVREACITAPNLVKIDVQGYELRVLAGAGRVLETAEVLIVEVNLFRFMPECPLAHEVISFLVERGFVLFDLAGSLRRPFEDDLAQLDLVFVSSRSRLVESARWS